MSGGLVTRPAVVMAAALDVMALYNADSPLAAIAINDVLAGMTEAGPLGSFYTEVAGRLVGWGLIAAADMRAVLSARAA